MHKMINMSRKNLRELTEAVSLCHTYEFGNIPLEEVNEFMWQLKPVLSGRIVLLYPDTKKYYTLEVTQNA